MAVRYVAIGFLGGLLAGLLGVGGGFVMVPLLIIWAGIHLPLANGVSLAAIVPLALVALLVYYFGSARPAVDLGLALPLIAGSVVGAYFGARLADRLPERQLKMAVTVLLALVGVKELILP